MYIISNINLFLSFYEETILVTAVVKGRLESVYSQSAGHRLKFPII